MDGEIAGVWRRPTADVSIDLWRCLSATERAALDGDASSLPLSGPFRVRTRRSHA